MTHNGDTPEHGAEHARSARNPESRTTDAKSACQSPPTAREFDGFATIANGLVASGPMTQRHVDWLESRGIDPELARNTGVTAARSPSGGDWISFPTIERGTIVGRQFRRIDKKDFSQQKGSRQTWWNGDVITDPALADKPLIVTEGRIDALSAITAGFPRSVSVPGGAPSTAGCAGDGKYAFVVDSLPAMKSIREIILATDADAPGNNLLHDLATRLGRGRCKFVTYPAGCKDLNDVLVQHGTEGVRRVIEGAKWYNVPGIGLMSDFPPVVTQTAYNTMIPGMNDHWRLRKADFTVITGIPGCGKSTFVNDVACRMAHHHGWHTCFASFEQFPQTDHRRSLRTWNARALAREMTEEERRIADKWIDEFFSFIVPVEDEECDLMWLMDKMAAVVIRYGTDMFVIDPWNELDHFVPKGMTMTEYVGKSIKSLKKFAREWNVHLILVAHPAKMSRDRDGKFPVPGLYDIADSAMFANKPDVGIVVHKGTDEHGEHALIRVVKSRYRDQIGEPGEVKLRFERDTSRFTWP